MLRVVAFCRLLLVVLAVSFTSFVTTTSPASARPHHGATRHAPSYHHIRHHIRWQATSQRPHHYHATVTRQPGTSQTGEGRLRFAGSYAAATQQARHAARTVRYQPRQLYRRIARSSRWERSVVEVRKRGVAYSYAAVVPNTGGVTFESSAASGSSLIAEARRHLGGNPTGRGSLWCARFMNMVLQHTGHRGTGSDMASSFANYGRRVSGPQVGAIAVMSRGRRGGHVGIITGIDASGKPIMISGNNRNRVREAPVSRGRIYTYVMPH